MRAVDAVRGGLPGEANELRLLRSLDVVLVVRDSLPKREASIVTRWVVEMTRGMAIYAHRPRRLGETSAPFTVPDLERYCYFVAGTVGHMLTDLFVERLGLSPALEVALRANAESFGVGLQLVNILKDLTDVHTTCRPAQLLRTSPHYQSPAANFSGRWGQLVRVSCSRPPPDVVDRAKAAA